MEPCKNLRRRTVCVVRVTRDPNIYTYLRFAILASTGLPRALGALLWSLLHMLALLFFLLALLAAFTAGSLLALLVELAVIVASVFLILALAVVWACLGITCCCCCCCRAPHPRPAGQSRWHYFLSAGGTLRRLPPPVDDDDDDDDDDVPGLGWEFVRDASFVFRFLEHVQLVSFPFWSRRVRNLCAEVVPSTDYIVLR